MLETKASPSFGTVDITARCTVCGDRINATPILDDTLAVVGSYPWYHAKNGNEDCTADAPII